MAYSLIISNFASTGFRLMTVILLMGKLFRYLLILINFFQYRY